MHKLVDVIRVCWSIHWGENKTWGTLPVDCHYQECDCHLQTRKFSCILKCLSPQSRKWNGLRINEL